MGALLTRSIIALLNGILRRVYLLWIGLIGILYAATDELHQYFVPGRSCDFTDWLADIAGLACGALIIYIIAMGKKKTDQADQQIIG